MKRLMLDEMISPSLEDPLWEAGVDTASIRGRDLFSASDARVWSYAQTERRTLQLGITDHVWSIGELVNCALHGEIQNAVRSALGSFRVIDGGRA